MTAEIAAVRADYLIIKGSQSAATLCKIPVLDVSAEAVATSDRLGPEVLAYLVLLATALGGFVGARWWAILIGGFLMSAVRASSLRRRVIEIEKEWRDRRRTIAAPAWAWVVAASTCAHLAICAVFYGIGLGLARMVLG